jgi:lipopolysaccharide/colanic/teichoic acid biosynthesis glycosyltransferase
MAPVSRSIPSTGFSGHYSQIIVTLKAGEAEGLTVFSHVHKPKIKKSHTHTMSPVAFVIIIITVIIIIIIIIVNQTHAAQYVFRNLLTTSQHFMWFKFNTCHPPEPVTCPHSQPINLAELHSTT